MWKIRPQDDEQFGIGHEYWFTDGVHIGYHGFPRSGAASMSSAIANGTTATRSRFASRFIPGISPATITPFWSAMGRAYTRAQISPSSSCSNGMARRYVGPKVVAVHRGTFKGQHAHCHPRFTQDGKRILYVSDQRLLEHLSDGMGGFRRAARSHARPVQAALTRTESSTDWKVCEKMEPSAETKTDNWTFWYRQPAEHWYDGLPLANGRIGGMVYGGVRVERIDLSETTFWSGEQCSATTIRAQPEIFREVRQRLLSRVMWRGRTKWHTSLKGAS